MRQPDGRISPARHWVYRRGLATHAVTAPITKHSARPLNAEAILSDLDHCISSALSGTPGPTHLALAFDFDDAAMFKRERLEQSLARSITDLDTARSAM